jgi:hypothetical protein
MGDVGSRRLDVMCAAKVGCTRAVRFGTDDVCARGELNPHVR